jgi:hypothetical protein
MPDSRQSIQVTHSAEGGVRVSIPAGTSLDKIFVNKALIKGIRGGPGGCQACLSGKDLHLQQFEKVILVELAE